MPARVEGPRRRRVLDPREGAAATTPVGWPLGVAVRCGGAVVLLHLLEIGEEGGGAGGIQRLGWATPSLRRHHGRVIWEPWRRHHAHVPRAAAWLRGGRAARAGRHRHRHVAPTSRPAVHASRVPAPSRIKHRHCVHLRPRQVRRRLLLLGKGRLLGGRRSSTGHPSTTSLLLLLLRRRRRKGHGRRVCVTYVHGRRRQRNLAEMVG